MKKKNKLNLKLKPNESTVAFAVFGRRILGVEMQYHANFHPANFHEPPDCCLLYSICSLSL